VRAAVFSPDAKFRLEELTLPAPQAHEAVVAVEACGICGSDRQLVHHGDAPSGTRFPAVLGHEIAGAIVALGRTQEGRNPEPWRVGDKVLVYPFVGCGACRLCQAGLPQLCPSQQVIGYHRWGGFADQVLVPMGSLLPRPASASAAAAALLVDAFATPFHAMRQVRCAPGERVLVCGAGGLGTAALYLAKAMNAGAVGLLSRRPEGLAELPTGLADEGWTWSDTSRKAGREIRRWAQGGVDVVIDTTGSAELVEFALDVLRPGGRIALVGMQPEEVRLPLAKTVRRGVTLSASYGSTMEDIRQLLKLVDAGQLNPESLVGATYALADIDTAFAAPVGGGRTVMVP